MLLTPDELVERLEMEARHSGSQSALAERYGFTRAYISRVINGYEAPSERLAEAMGYERVFRYRPISGT